MRGVGEDQSSSTNAISASPALLRACAAASTYAADGPSDFDTPADKSLPASVAQELAKDTNGASVVHFKAPVVGDVYAFGDQEATFLYDLNGRELAHGVNDSVSTMAWFDVHDVALDCSTTPYNVHTISSSSSSSGWSSSSSSGWTDTDASATTDDASTSDDGADGGIDVVGPDGGIDVGSDAGH